MHRSQTTLYCYTLILFDTSLFESFLANNHILSEDVNRNRTFNLIISKMTFKTCKVQPFIYGEIK